MNTASTNYTFSLWYYVTSWTQTTFNKALLIRMNSDPSLLGSRHATFYVGLDKELNNLIVQVTSLAGSSSITNTCSVDNVPLQAWVNVLVSVYGRSIDVYIDGKLTKTCVMPGTAISTGIGDILITPNTSDLTQGTYTSTTPNIYTGSSPSLPATQCAGNGTTLTDTTYNCEPTQGGCVEVSPQASSPGNYNSLPECHAQCNDVTGLRSAGETLATASSPYHGYIDSVRYWDTATNPQQAYNIYKDGPDGANWFSNLFNKYYIKVQFFDNNVATGGFEI